MFLKFLPMFRIVILTLLFCLASSGAGQIVDRASVAVAVKATVDDYFVSHLSMFCEDYADGVFDKRTPVNDVSKLYIEPNHFFYNDRKYDSYAVWVREYIETSLHGVYYNHRLSLLLRDLQKELLDRYTVPVELVRVDPVTNKEVGAKFRLLLTFVYQGVGQYVHIMRLDGDIPDLPLPAPKETAEPAQVAVDAPASGASSGAIKAYLRDSINSDSLALFFLSEAWLLLVEYWVLALLLGFLVFILFFSFGKEELRYTSRLQQVLGSGGLTLVVGLVVLGVLTATVRMENPSRMRPHVLDAYDDYRIDSLYRVVAVKQGDKWGLVNYAGRVLHPVGLDSISPFSSSYSLVMSGKRYGYLQPDGKFVGWYDFGTPVVDNKGVFGLRLDDSKPDITYSAFDLMADGEVYTVLPYDRVEHWHGSLYRVRTGHQYGLIDPTGRVVLPVEYDGIDWPHNDRAVIMKTSGSTELQRISNRREGLIDTAGKIIITPSSYWDIARFYDGLAKVTTTGSRVGYIDPSGKLVIPCRFIDGHNFQKGMACARQNKIPGYWGVIDRKGNWVVQPEYQNVYDLATMYGISRY